jgi:hypothetical protein
METEMSLNASQGELRMALAEYLRSNPLIDLDDRKQIREVVGFKELTERRGGCETCEYDVVKVVVYYETWDGELANWEIEESFGSLISDLEDTVKEYGEHTEYSYFN